MERCCRGFLARFLFLLHGFLTIYILFINKNFQSIHFAFATPLVFLVMESVATLCIRRGKEWTYVWPCGFFYIASIVPIIWVLKLGALEERSRDISSNTTIFVEMARLIGENDTSMIHQVLVPEALKMSDVSGRRFCEVGVLIGLIIGRWINPRGSLSRNQLSTMLLGFVATSADILEFIDTIEIRQNNGNAGASGRTYVILTVYTWAMLQFAVVTALPSANNNNTDVEGKPAKKITVSSPIMIETKETESGGKVVQYSLQNDAQDDDDNGNRCIRWHSDLPEMFVGLLMQDGPFLTVRLYLCTHHEDDEPHGSEPHIFFLCKNTIIVLLYLYRFVILMCEKEREGKGVKDMAVDVVKNLAAFDKRNR